MDVEETPTGYVVKLAVPEGEVAFAFEEMEQFRTHQLETRLTTWQRIPGQSIEPFSARLNILSLSNREAYRRNLDDAFGKGGWTTLLNRACSVIESYWKKRSRSVDFTEIPESESVAFFCHPLLVRGANIIFGQGDSGKTWLALALARSHVIGEPVIGMDWGTRGNALYIDYEADAQTLSERCQLLGGRPSGLRYWPGSGVPLSEQVPGLKREISRHEISFVVVDSAGLACGGEPEKAEMAIRYFNAVQSLGVPSLTIAHLRKGGEDDTQPFGSNFWHTSARQIWKVKGSQDEGEVERRMGLFHMKWNNVPRRERPIGIRIRMDSGRVVMERGEVEDDVRPGGDSVGQRIRRLLAGGKMSVNDLADALDKRPSHIRTELGRLRGVVQLGKTDDGSYEWGLLSNEE